MAGRCLDCFEICDHCGILPDGDKLIYGEKEVCFSYCTLFFCGVCGIHRVYLRESKVATFICLCFFVLPFVTLGFSVLIGMFVLFYDCMNMKKLVDDANKDFPWEKKEEKKEMKENNENEVDEVFK